MKIDLVWTLGQTQTVEFMCLARATWSLRRRLLYDYSCRNIKHWVADDKYSRRYEVYKKDYFAPCRQNWHCKFRRFLVCINISRQAARCSMLLGELLTRGLHKATVDKGEEDKGETLQHRMVAGEKISRLFPAKISRFISAFYIHEPMPPFRVAFDHILPRY